MKQKITAGVTLLTALLLGVGPWTFFKACPVTPEKIMKCHWCCLALIPLALVLGVAGIVQLMAKSREARQAVCLPGGCGVYWAQYCFRRFSSEAVRNRKWRVMF